jgi:hypothetical protein
MPEYVVTPLLSRLFLHAPQHSVVLVYDVAPRWTTTSWPWPPAPRLNSRQGGGAPGSKQADPAPEPAPDPALELSGPWVESRLFRLESKLILPLKPFDQNQSTEAI